MALNVYSFPARSGETSKSYIRRVLKDVSFSFRSERVIYADHRSGTIRLFGTASGPVSFVKSEAQPSLTPIQLLDRMTFDERQAVRQSDDPSVSDAHSYLLAATEVDPGDARTRAFMDALVSAGILTQDRADEVLYQWQ